MYLSMYLVSQPHPPVNIPLAHLVPEFRPTIRSSALTLTIDQPEI